MGDLFQVATDRGQLARRLPDGAQLRLWEGRQGSQVRTEQDGGIGRRRQTTGGGTCLEQLSVATPQADINARLTCQLSISSSTDQRRASGLQHENKHSLEQRGLCELLPLCCCTKCRFRCLRHATLDEGFGCHESHRVTAAAESLSCVSRQMQHEPSRFHDSSNSVFQVRRS